MDEAVAYSTLALTVTLAVSRPRVGPRALRFTPGTAALVGVAVLLIAGLLHPDDLVASARVQWRPLLALTSVMVMTGVVREVGASLAGNRPGNEIEHPMAVVILGGLVTSTALNLLVVPALYLWLRMSTRRATASEGTRIR